MQKIMTEVKIELGLFVSTAEGPIKRTFWRN